MARQDNLSLFGYASYDYQKAYNTYTLDQYIACQSDTAVCYANLSFSDIRDNIKYASYNVVSDYIDELRDEYCVTVTLSDEEADTYKYKPKLLCHNLYGNGELAFLILFINDMCSIKDFTKHKLLLPRKNTMIQLVKYLYNANKQSIDRYNAKNN